MGELAPILSILVVAIIVLGVWLSIRAGNRNVVTKPIEELDSVERVKIQITSKKAIWLRDQLNLALEAKSTNGTDIDFYESDDRLVRLTVK